MTHVVHSISGSLAHGGENRILFSLFWVCRRRDRAMGEVHSHQFRPVGEIWLKGEENELSFECGEKLWVIFEDSHSPNASRRGLRTRFHDGLNRFSRVDTA